MQSSLYSLESKLPAAPATVHLGMCRLVSISISLPLSPLAALLKLLSPNFACVAQWFNAYSYAN